MTYEPELSTNVSRRSVARRVVSILLVFVLAVGVVQLDTEEPAEASTFYLTVTEGTYDAFRTAASQTQNTMSCSVDRERLQAYLLSIPLHEIFDGSSTLAPSPMSVSRWDTLVRPINIYTFSYNRTQSDVNAQFPPGVGPLQIDNIGRNGFESRRFNVGQRMDQRIAGKIALSEIAAAYCMGGSAADKHSEATDYIAGAFFACQYGECAATFDQIYDGDLIKHVRRLSQFTDIRGGARLLNCRTSETGFVPGRKTVAAPRQYASTGIACYYIDLDNAEGDLAAEVNGMTPLPRPFFSYNLGTYQFNTWRLTTGPTDCYQTAQREITKWVSRTKATISGRMNVRQFSGWHCGDRGLQVNVNGTWVFANAYHLFA